MGDSANATGRTSKTISINRSAVTYRRGRGSRGEPPHRTMERVLCVCIEAPEIAEVAMKNTDIYQDIASRTGGSLFIGVLGPVRTGKSTFIKRFMETCVIPNIDNIYRRERAIDELPQSGSGRTIMTAEPKFVPEEAVELTLEGGGTFAVRLIDSVGYMVQGAMGQMEDGEPRMVMTPWMEHEIPMAQAAELGTQKVITEHSTVGIVITTDGTITDIPREDYLEAEERVIRELQELGKPFVVLLNSEEPSSSRAMGIAADLEQRLGVRCLPVNCLELSETSITEIIKGILYEFPLREMQIYLPPWVDALEPEHLIRQNLYQVIRSGGEQMAHIRDVAPVVQRMGEADAISLSRILRMDLGQGIAAAELQLPRELFYQTLSAQSGFSVQNDGDLIKLLTELAAVKEKYDKVSSALDNVYETGYGIVMPTKEDLVLEEPEIIRQAGRYGVKLKASAPSIHMFKVDITSAVSPIVGNEKQSEDMVNYLMDTGNPTQIWESSIFGRSFHEMVNDDLQAKLYRMPMDARMKFQETLQRIVNEGSGGLICIIL